MKTKTLFIALACALAIGCGGDEDGGTGEDRRLDKLTASERDAFCDWIAEQWGGYGKEHECSAEIFVSGPESRAECAMPTKCTATVEQSKKRIKAMVRDKCKDEPPAECLALPASC